MNQEILIGCLLPRCYQDRIIQLHLPPIRKKSCFVVAAEVRLSEVGSAEVCKPQVARSIRVAGSILSTRLEKPHQAEPAIIIRIDPFRGLDRNMIRQSGLTP
jgi:hypothetical protein